MLWEDKVKLLSLYNATHKTHYSNPDDLHINTLRNAIYMGMKNDVSFIFEMSLNLYEHQSTVNPNMPLRDLFYVAQVLQGIVNVNPGHNQELLDNCQPLREYVLYIEKIKNYVTDMPIEQAVTRAVDECIAEGILADFLKQNKAEAIA